jgi:Tfp pilus assembly protein PilF
MGGLICALAVVFFLCAVLSAEPPPPSAHVNDKLSQCKSNDIDQAIAGCTAVINSGKSKNQQLAEAFYERGVAYTRKSDLDHGLQDIERAIKFNPRSAKSFCARGSIYTRKGDSVKAIQDVGNPNAPPGSWENETHMHVDGGKYHLPLSTQIPGEP